MHMSEENPNAQLMKSSTDSFKKKKRENIDVRDAREGKDKAQTKGKAG